MNARRVAATLTLLTLPFGLAACGGSSKPSKADVKAGMQKSIDKKLESLSGSSNLPKGTSKKMADCVTDKVYDKLSDNALKALKDSKDEAKGIKQSDKDAMDTATKSCATSILGTS